MVKINENLFSAIDIIIAKRLEQLAFDRTIVCTIKQALVEKPNWYIVSYRDLSFEVFSNIDSLKPGDQVYVLIPENNEENRRFIIGIYYQEVNQNE